MTGEVKRYAFYDRHTGVEVDPTEILPGDTTNDDTFIAHADHLAVVEGLRADALMSAYKLGTVDMLAARATGLEAIEEACADDLDGLWRQMTKEQRGLINAWCAILPPAWTGAAIDEAMRHDP